MWPICRRVLVWAAALSALPLARAAEPAPPQYKVGEAIPVSCLKRNFETGEHITDANGRLQYIPFPECKETERPLELYFGREKDMNCTIEMVDDHFFHLLEFYIHNDAPMTCRLPARPFSLESDSMEDTQVGTDGSENSRYIPFTVVLTGILQKSHLHVANNLNILLHAAPKSLAPGVIDAAIAYSTSHRIKNTKIIIGDSLPLRLSVRWYPNPTLPSGWTGVGGHLFLSTVMYCILSAGAATAICIAYYRGVALPKRLRTYGHDRTFAAPRYTGYGYGIGNGYGYTPSGKVD